MAEPAVLTQNRALIAAPAQIVFRLAAEVEFWPALLPHYRYVRVLRRAGPRRLVTMGATRAGIPVSWTSLQWLEPDAARITFRHVAGITRGLVVEWAIVASSAGPTDVTICHDFRPSWPLIGTWAAERAIGSKFLCDIAGKTLREIKRIAEAGGLPA